MSEKGSIASLDTLSTEGCPFTDSILYDYQEAFNISLKKLKNRNAVTEYIGKSKMIVGRGCQKHDGKNRSQRSQTYRNRTKQSNQEMIFTCL